MTAGAIDMNAFVGVAGLAVGVVSVIVAVVLYRRSQRMPVLICSSTSSVVVDRGDSELLELRFRGVPVARVTRTTFLIWNEGRGALRADDIAAGSPLRVGVHVGDEVVLAARVAAETAVHEADVAIEANGRVRLSLAFLRPRETIEIEVLHTAGATATAFLSSTIIGGPDMRWARPSRWEPWASRAGGALLVAGTALLVGGAIRTDIALAVSGYGAWLAALAAIRVSIRLERLPTPRPRERPHTLGYRFHEPADEGG